MQKNTLSILVPVFNEASLIEKTITKLLRVDLSYFQTEILLIDDGSTDDTLIILNKISTRYPKKIKVLHQNINQGKGAALKLGLKHAQGQIIAIQDADQEYDANDLAKLAKYLNINLRYQAVYGSRVLGKKIHKSMRSSGRLFYIGGILLTKIVNLAFNLHLTDQPTGYKIFRRNAISKILKISTCQGFDFEIELTFALSRLGVIKELPIHYFPRSIADGKKIQFFDFIASLKAIYLLLKINN